MKKVLPFGVLSLLIVKLTYSQGYIPFPSQNASWTEQNYFCDWGGGTTGNASIFNYRYWYGSDTTINSLVYHILIRNGEFYYKDCTGPLVNIYQYNPPVVAAYLRSDSLLHRVYYLRPDTNAEVILYDFNLSINDTILPSELINPPLFASYIRVASKDSFYSDKAYPRYNFEIYDTLEHSWFGGNSWIEGIGSISGLFHPIYNDHWMGAGGQQLTCFDNSGSTIYPSFSTQGCAQITGIHELNKSAELFTISPNPATTTVTINIDEAMLGSTATITDITGRKMAAIKLETLNSKLQMESFANGVYFITVANERQSATRKLVVSR